MARNRSPEGFVHVDSYCLPNIYSMKSELAAVGIPFFRDVIENVARELKAKIPNRYKCLFHKKLLYIKKPRLLVKFNPTSVEIYMLYIDKLGFLTPQSVLYARGFCLVANEEGLWLSNPGFDRVYAGDLIPLVKLVPCPADPEMLPGKTNKDGTYNTSWRNGHHYQPLKKPIHKV